MFKRQSVGLLFPNWSLHFKLIPTRCIAIVERRSRNDVSISLLSMAIAINNKVKLIVIVVAERARLYITQQSNSVYHFPT